MYDRPYDRQEKTMHIANKLRAGARKNGMTFDLPYDAKMIWSSSGVINLYLVLMSLLGHPIVQVLR